MDSAATPAAGTTQTSERSYAAFTGGSTLIAVSVDITTPRTMNWSDVQEYADFTRDFLVAVREARQAGKTADEAAATLRLPDRYKTYGMQRAKANVEAIYSELGPLGPLVR